MKKLLLIVMACYGLNTSAQVRQSKNFLYLYSDSVIYADRIRLRPDFGNSFQLRADSRRVPVAQVKFFNNEDGFFANTRKVDFGGFTAFSERIIEGRINLFQRVSYDTYLYDREYNKGYRFRNRRDEGVDIRMYYNKGYEDLKKVNYHNLKMDMADNAQSMQMLEGYRKSTRNGTILYAAAGASLVAGLVSFLVNGSSGQKSFNNNGFGSNGFNGKNSAFEHKGANFTASFVLLGLGAGFAIGGYTVGASGNRHLENAVDAYNK